ncbi:hypothetical protein SNOG_12720 [Parastagonospora nodorum SN15]|nr:hypothetical protein SNOG_12720 [Parastagonospora nodorum SN15]EAT80018.2 hypothetical protein SNOG_12720 [Parastagonospora nodorum SN15]
MFYHPMMFAIRASIIMFLWRMKDKRRRIRYSLHAVWWLNIIYGISTTLGNILQCTPVQYAWARPAMDTMDADGNLVKGGTCFDSRTFVLTSCALSIFMDVIIIPIPSIMVWNLQMERKTKMLVVIVMSLGWIATGVSVGRFIVYYYRIAPTNKDRTWDIGVSISIAEPAVHIMTACAPATKRLFRYLFPYFARSRTTGNYYEDRVTTNKSTGVRRNFNRFSFGLNKDEEEGAEEIGMAPKKDGDVDRGFGMKRLSTVDSREESKEDKSSIHVAEAEPQHCLGLAK